MNHTVSFRYYEVNLSPSVYHRYLVSFIVNNSSVYQYITRNKIYQMCCSLFIIFVLYICQYLKLTIFYRIREEIRYRITETKKTLFRRRINLINKALCDWQRDLSITFYSEIITGIEGMVSEYFSNYAL